MAGKLRPDFKTLELIVLAADTGSISRAAVRQSVSLASASRRISEFEQRIGLSLFDRHARGITVSRAGGSVLERLRLMLDELDRLDDAIADVRGGVKEHLALLACEAAIIQFLPDILRDFVAQNPQVQIELAERRSTEIVRAVSERQRGFGILWSDVHAGGLVTQPFRDDELAIVVPAAHPFRRGSSVSFAEALSYDFVCLEAESPLYQCLQREATRLRRTLRARIQVRGFDAICRMVEAGLGIGVVPMGVASSMKTSMRIRLLRLREPWAKRALSIVHRGERELRPVEQRFIAFCSTPSPPPAQA